MKIIAIFIASLVAVVTMIFHLVSGSSLLILLLRVAVAWFGFYALVLFLEFALSYVLSSPHHQEEGYIAERKRLDLVSSVDDDEFFR
jgi:cell division protein FtsB